MINEFEELQTHSKYKQLKFQIQIKIIPLACSSQRFSDDIRLFFSTGQWENTVGIAPDFSIGLGFASISSARRSRSKHAGSKCSEQSTVCLEILTFSREMFEIHIACTLSSFGSQ